MASVVVIVGFTVVVIAIAITLPVRLNPAGLGSRDSPPPREYYLSS